MLDRMIERIERRLRMGPTLAAADFLRAEVTALTWAREILLGDHAKSLGEVIRLQHARKGLSHDLAVPRRPCSEGL